MGRNRLVPQLRGSGRHGSTSEAHDYAYTDAAVVPGATYLYRLADVDYSGKVTYHKEVEVRLRLRRRRRR
jgi:hypothetical protein